MSASGMSGAVLVAVDSFRPSLVARSTGHQALLVGMSAAIGYTAGVVARRALGLAGVRNPIMRSPLPRTALFGAAAAVSLPVIALRTRQEREAHADWGVPPMRPALAAAQGTLVAAGLVGGAELVKRGVVGMSSAASRRWGGPPALWGTAFTAVAVEAAAAAWPLAERALYAKLAVAGTTPDPVFTAAPTMVTVSGGPGSLVPYETHAREGSRFVNLVTPKEKIAAVTGRPAVDPIRVFVGVSAAATPDERVALAVTELERLGAFDRRRILVMSPAGTGYVNPVPAETLELLSGGDCATVAVQYGVLPSMFSTALLPTAAQTYRALVDAVTGRGPAVYCYGESLGAQAAQMGLQAEPSRWQTDGSFKGIDASLFVGTPAGTGIRRQSEHRPAVFVADRWQDLPTPLPPQYAVFLLDHDADPVTRFERSLIWSRPDWLTGKARGRGVPEAIAWRPLLTYLQVMFDVARATQPQLGKFQSHGHDYRADLAALVRAAFAREASDEELAAVGEELLRSELHRAELLSVKG